MSYRISILKRSILDRTTPDDALRCPKVWEGERCRLGVHHDAGHCIISPPGHRTDTASAEDPSVTSRPR